MKKKMDEKASGVTDATPLVEIRAAIQRLKKENRELDVRIGLLVSAKRSVCCDVPSGLILPFILHTKG